MRLFIDCLKRLRKEFDELSLVSNTSLRGLELAPGYVYEQWRNNPDNLEAHRFISRMLSKAPSYDFAALAAGDTNYYFGDTQTFGLAAAHVEGGLAVSLAGADHFRIPMLPIFEAAIAADEHGQEDFIQIESYVRNAWSADIGDHEEWLVETRAAIASTAWARSASLQAIVAHCDKLALLPNAYQQLSALEGRTRESVFQSLVLLQASVAAWDPAHSTLPMWKTKVSPESQSRLNSGIVSFNDSDGLTYDFGWHARYTPGAGRIHFRLDYEQSQLRIAYIGSKLE